MSDETKDQELDEDDDFPRDVCYTCGVSPTRAEARGYQRAIDDLRDSQRQARYGADRAVMKIAAEYLESKLPAAVTNETRG